MPRGGKRPGAGRKAGSAHKKTRTVADRAAEEGITPLEVMLAIMQDHYRAKRYEEAASVARDAAPYCHPRLAAIKHTGPSGGAIEHEHDDITGLSEDELVARYLAKVRASGLGDDGP
jgi:hypothetical protein